MRKRQKSRPLSEVTDQKKCHKGLETRTWAMNCSSSISRGELTVRGGEHPPGLDGGEIGGGDVVAWSPLPDAPPVRRLAESFESQGFDVVADLLEPAIPEGRVGQIGADEIGVVEKTDLLESGIGERRFSPENSLPKIGYSGKPCIVELRCAGKRGPEKTGILGEPCIAEVGAMRKNCVVELHIFPELRLVEIHRVMKRDIAEHGAGGKPCAMKRHRGGEDEPRAVHLSQTAIRCAALREELLPLLLEYRAFLTDSGGVKDAVRFVSPGLGPGFASASPIGADWRGVVHVPLLPGIVPGIFFWTEFTGLTESAFVGAHGMMPHGDIQMLN